MINSGSVLIEVTRGCLTESTHRGAIVVVDAEGTVLASTGAIDTRTYFRSAAKPFQAIPLLTSGAAARFGLNTRELAVIIGSHGGEAIHRETVSAILRKVGLTEDLLQCGTHTPFDSLAAKELRAAGRKPGLLHNNCSGKHAGMLAQAVHRGLSTADYLDPNHPIQREILEVIADFSGESAAEIAIGVDGCSAPVFGLSLLGMARSYARLVNPLANSLNGVGQRRQAAERVVAAMLEFPEMIAGTRGRLDTDLMRHLPGRLISKVGAEGVQLLGILPCSQFPAGAGIAIKIEDGDIRRARDPVVIETLRQLGILEEPQLDALRGYACGVILNPRQIEVGEIRASFKLSLG